MRALTLTQPWAGLVASGIKLVENRPRHMIKGADILAHTRFAVHASREIDQLAYHRIFDAAPELRPELADTKDKAHWHQLARVTSAVIAVATLRDALFIGGNIRETTMRMLDKLGIPEQMRFTFGPTVYVLEASPVVLRAPVPCRGHQGFWTLSPELDAAVRAQMGAAA